MNEPMTDSGKTDQAIPRIAFMGDPLAGWGGGVDFLAFCISALASACKETSFVMLLPGKRTVWQTIRHWASPIKRAYKILLGKDRHRGQVITRDDLRRAITSAGGNIVIDIIDYRKNTSGLANAMRQNKVEVLYFCATSLGGDFPLPWIGYIADLQHKRMPHWFSKKECKSRDRLFSRLLRDASVVVVNAKSVIQDIEEFYPEHRASLVALPYCPPAKLELFSNTSDADVRAAYQLPSCYFLISNQFTVHKSHETAFRALRIVRDAGHDVHIVCTGDMYDYRWPEHCDNLKAIIEKNGMTPYIRFLGFIPKEHQLAIMRGSAAVVQPTLFEGGPGGGAVYDAVSTGTPSIVSDIPVNREIDIGTVWFFRAGSAEDLAAKMADMLTSRPEPPDKEETFGRLIRRQQELGNLLIKLSDMVMSPHDS